MTQKYNISKKDSWIHEIFLLFYLFFFSCVFINKLIPDHVMLQRLVRVAGYIYAPAIIFGIGGLIGSEDPTQKDFKIKNLWRAFFCYAIFVVYGFAYELLVRSNDVFEVLKDLLIINRVPSASSIFITAAIFFVIAGTMWDFVEKCLSRWYTIVAVGFAGFLFTLLPDRLLGYGLLGIFVGSDNFRCTPAVYYLLIFFAGILFAREKFRSLTDKKILTSIGILMILTAIFVVFHKNNATYVLIGTILAYIGLIISRLFLPGYRLFEKKAISIIEAAFAFAKTCRQKTQESRILSTIAYYMTYTILFIIIMYFAFYPFIKHGVSFAWESDALGQYLPKAHRFIDVAPQVVKALFNGNLDFPQYDFTNGLGCTLTSSFEPVYWLYLLFDHAQIDWAYTALIILRFYIAGISMSFMLRYFKKSNFVAYTGTFVYLLSEFGLFSGTRHAQFLVPMILLPILIVSMEELIRKNKWYLLTIFTAISLLCSYYFLYMNTVALGIYFVTRILTTKEYRNLKAFFTKGLIIVGSYIMGTAMGCVTLFTSFGQYMGSNRSIGESISRFYVFSPLFYRNQWIVDLFVSHISSTFSPGAWVEIGLAPIALLALVLLFTRQKKKELRPIFIILSIFLILPICGYVLNGFGNISNRWCYVYVLFVTYILAEYLEDFQESSKFELIMMIGLSVFYGIVVLITERFHTFKVYGSYGLLLLTLVVILFLNMKEFKISKRIRQVILFTTIAFTLIVNANFYFENPDFLRQYSPVNESLNRMSDTALAYLDEVTDEENDQEYFRSTNLQTDLNTRSSSLIHGYNDISFYNSTVNGNIVNFNNQMGNCNHILVYLVDYNFRTMLNELSGIKYLASRSDNTVVLPYGYDKVLEKTKDDGTTYCLYENKYALPIGYTYSSVMSDKEAQEYNSAQKQELAMTTAIIDDDKVEACENIGVNKDPDLTVHELPITNIVYNNIHMEDDTMIVDSDEASITFEFEGEENCETYLRFEGDAIVPQDAGIHLIGYHVKADDVSYFTQIGQDAYRTGQTEYLYNLGYRENSIHSCTLEFINKATIENVHFSVYSQNMDEYAKEATALKENVLENVKVGDNSVRGTIKTTEDKMLVITLPYQKGWKAYVDGEETSLQRANYQYMGINLPAGEHEIVMEYRIPGVKYCIMITCAGVAIFLLLMCFSFLIKIIKSKTQKE